MKIKLLALTGMFLLSASGGSVSAAQPSAAENISVSAPAASQNIYALQSEDEVQEAQDQLPAVPVSVNITVTESLIEIDIGGKGAVIEDYNPELEKRTLIIPQAALIGPPQKVSVNQGLISNIQVHEIHEADGRKVIIDIYALSNPQIISQAGGQRITVSINSLDDAEAEEADEIYEGHNSENSGTEP